MAIEVVYAPEPFPERVVASLFLAGPTPRDAVTASWRPEALACLERLGFEGTVFIPEARGGVFRTNYDDQVDWEWGALARADAIVFWVPREMRAMPALTTNVEYGLFARSGRLVFGAPSDSERNRYLVAAAERLAIPVYDDLEAALRGGCSLAPPSLRCGVETQIPSRLWNEESFQSWYRAQRRAGHRLRRTEVVATYPSAGQTRPFLWVLHPHVEVAGENRVKENEVLVGRGDVVALACLLPADRLEDVEVCCVREYRAAVANTTGFVLELPGGSAPDGRVGPAVAIGELEEETGIAIPAERLVDCGRRQLAATLFSSQASLYAVVLDGPEAAAARAREGAVAGDPARGERTTVTWRRVGDLLEHQEMDWSMLAMVLHAARLALKRVPRRG